jgi:hypothetical protein
MEKAFSMPEPNIQNFSELIKDSRESAIRRDFF